MSATGWRRLIPPKSPFLGEGKYRIDAYSEFMPAPRLGWKPYGANPVDGEIFSEDDPWGWHVSEINEAAELQPGLQLIGKQVMDKLHRLRDDDPSTGLPKLHLEDNAFWPRELKDETRLPQERCVVLLPLAFSRTLDDKGRIRWTLFGNSEQGPGKAFWKSFYTAPGREAPAEEGIDFFCRLLNAVYLKKLHGAADLLQSGFRVLHDPEPAFDFWKHDLPTWTEPFVLGERASLKKVQFIVTFRPFGRLPPAVRKAYLAGDVRLLPFPGSLAFWGVKDYWSLHQALPLALQIPLLLNIARHQMPSGVRVPQSGFLHEPNAAHPLPHSNAGQVRNTFKRTHRWDKIHRDADELALITKEHKMLDVLFSTNADHLSLYDKPMARNVQLWTHDHRLLLDGPRATPAQIKKAMEATEAGGMFGYRFHFPAMRVGEHEIYWHRPLVAYRDGNDDVVVLADAPLGWMTAYKADKPNLARPLELWPRLQRRALPLAALAECDAHAKSGNVHGTGHPADVLMLRNVRKLFDAFHLVNRPLPRSFARQLLTVGRGVTLDSWSAALPNPTIAAEVGSLLEPEAVPLPRRRSANVPASLTYQRTARRSFEVRYWKTIAALAQGAFQNKNNADCVLDPTTQELLSFHDRQLEGLGDFLLAYYGRTIDAAGMSRKALAGEMPFRWRTDFEYSWMGGWCKNINEAAERDLIVVIPGRDRSRAVIMADHYDTAYMADRYQKEYGGCGARLAACGADDNYSATAAMMLAAPIFLDLSKKGKLDCDIWLVHLTGEEFPADSLGARALSQRLVERTLNLHLPGGKKMDLSKTTVQGLYVSDMIAHNNDNERQVFQISPGTGPASMWLAYQAHMANEIWNESAVEWNKAPERNGKPPGRRSADPAVVPEIAPFLALSGQVRPSTDPRSTLYNTDGQVFSDTGVPCVLFMENYDINRYGYHDTHDTMENIDLDYGSAFCAITIESVARAATESPPKIDNQLRIG